MENCKNDTVAAILESGKREFLQYGYEKASMRRIAREADVTTGAIYGYFPGKEALFEKLTGEAADELLNMYRKVHEEFARMEPMKQVEGLMTVTEENIPGMIDYIYGHFDQFKLLFCSSPSGICDDYISQLTQIEEEATYKMVEAVKSLGYCPEEMDDTLVHILTRSFFQQILEFVAHDVPKEKARSYALTLGRFQHAGWIKIMGL